MADMETGDVYVNIRQADMSDTEELVAVLGHENVHGAGERSEAVAKRGETQAQNKGLFAITHALMLVMIYMKCITKLLSILIIALLIATPVFSEKEFKVPDTSKPVKFKPKPKKKIGDIEYTNSNIAWNATAFDPKELAFGFGYESLNAFRIKWRYVNLPKGTNAPKVYLYLGNSTEGTLSQSKGFYDKKRDFLFVNLNKINLKNRGEIKMFLTDAAMLRYLNLRTKPSSIPDRRVYLEFRDKYDFSVQFEGYNSPFKRLISHHEWLETHSNDPFLLEGLEEAKKAEELQYFKEAWPMVKDKR